MAHFRMLILLTLFVMAGCSLPSTGDDDEVSEAPIAGAPEVSIASPRANSTYLAGVPVNIQVMVFNAGEDLARLDFFVDNQPIASLQQPNPTGADVFSATQTWPAEGAGAHTVSVVASRSSGVSNEPVSVRVSVVESVAPSEDAGIIIPAEEATSPPDTAVEDTPQPADNPTDAPTEAPTDEPPTDEPEPTDPPEPTASPTPAVPTIRATGGMNVRSGPSLNFNPPIGVLTANQTAEVLAVNPAGSWYKINFNNREGWVFADLVEVVSGDISGLPVEIGPPTPPPPTITPIPATPTPSVTNNLVVFNHFSNPPVPQCGQTVTMGMSIRNDGTQSLSTGTGRIQIVRASDGTPIASSENAFVPIELPPGGVHAVQTDFRIDVFVGERHRVEFIADVDNQVAETIETDNMQVIEYTLPDNC